MPNPLIEIKHESGVSNYVRAKDIIRLNTKDKKVKTIDNTVFNFVTNILEIVQQVNASEKE